MEEIIEVQPTQEPMRLTVGEEFIAWAETYWQLKEKYEETTKDPAERSGESCPYDYVKKTFTQKIDELIKHRMAL